MTDGNIAHFLCLLSGPIIVNATQFAACTSILRAVQRGLSFCDLCYESTPLYSVARFSLRADRHCGMLPLFQSRYSAMPRGLQVCTGTSPVLFGHQKSVVPVNHLGRRVRYFIIGRHYRATILSGTGVTSSQRKPRIPW